jgi:hypothetical protein
MLNIKTVNSQASSSEEITHIMILSINFESLKKKVKENSANMKQEFDVF